MPNPDTMTDAELAEYYNSTHDLAEFDGGETVTPAPHDTMSQTRSVTLSVRLSPSELAELEERAVAAGMPVTTYIRAAALAAEEPPVDRGELLDLIAALRSKIETSKAAGAPSVKMKPGAGRAANTRTGTKTAGQRMKSAATKSASRTTTKSYDVAVKTAAERAPRGQ